MRIAIFDYRIIRTNPIGGCHRRSIEALSRDHLFTVFAVEFENPDPERVEWVRIPVPKRPLALLFIAFHILAPLWYLFYRLRTGVKFDLIQMVESNLSFGDVAYSQFCHRAYLQKHWKQSKPSGVRGLLRLIDHVLHALLEPFVYGRVQKIVVPSAGLARELSAVYPKAASKIRVLSNPVDVDKLEVPAGYDRVAAREAMGIQPSEIMMVFAALGQFERKGLPLILDAMKQLNDPRLRLCVVGGEADLVRTYEKNVQQMGLGSQVKFTGSQKDVRPFLWTADVFVLPSFYETFSLVSFEAAAAGLPLIVAPLHGVEDLMRSAACGFETQRTPEAVASAISRFTALGTEERRVLGEAAKKEAAHYSAGRFVQAWREFYASAGMPEPVLRSGGERSTLVTQTLPPIRYSSTEASRPQLPALTGLRGAAALWILLFQFGPALAMLLPGAQAVSAFTSKGFYGVDLFFILSGYILSYKYFRSFTWTGPGYLGFIRNRVARIYPVYLFTVLVLLLQGSLAGRTVSGAGHFSAGEVLSNLLLVQSWGFTDGTSWNAPAWSLSAQWFAYVVAFPLSCLLMKRVKTARALLVLAVAALFACTLFSPARSLSGVPLLLQVCGEFFIGSCICSLGDIWKVTEKLGTLLVNASVPMLLAVIIFSAPIPVHPVLIVGFGALIVGLSKSEGFLAKIFRSQTALYLGALSYSLFLTHSLFERLASVEGGPARFAHSPLALRLAVVVCSFTLMMLLASFVYHFIEVPARRWTRRKLRNEILAGFTIAGSKFGSERRPLRSRAV